MSSPLVSILMPAYHSEAFIERSIRSVLGQTYSNWELLIIADDGKEYAPVLDALAIRDKRIRLLSSGGVSTGPSRTRNVGLGEARGELVATLDSDDVFAPEKLERMAPKALEYGLACSALSIGFFNEDDTFTRIAWPGGRTCAEGYLEAGEYVLVNYSSHSHIVFNRKMLPLQWMENIRAMEDLVFVMQSYDYIDRLYYFSEMLQTYVRREGSLSNHPDTPSEFVAAKHYILDALHNDVIRIKHPEAHAALRQFMVVSILAEQEFAAAKTTHPDMHFSEFLWGKLRHLKTLG